LTIFAPWPFVGLQLIDEFLWMLFMQFFKILALFPFSPFLCVDLLLGHFLRNLLAAAEKLISGFFHGAGEPPVVLKRQPLPSFSFANWCKKFVRARVCFCKVQASIP